jgi:translation initiation factor 2B subunit (eIF-2B alpha/beta/delta family)
MVAMLAKEYRVPVVVAVETYKFTDGTRLDGLGSNEVDLHWMQRELGSEAGGEERKEDNQPNLTKLGLTYDLTAAEYITALCTEVRYFLCFEVRQLIHVTGRLHSPQLCAYCHWQDQCCSVIRPSRSNTIVAIVTL